MKTFDICTETRSSGHLDQEATESLLESAELTTDSSEQREAREASTPSSQNKGLRPIATADI